MSQGKSYVPVCIRLSSTDLCCSVESNDSHNFLRKMLKSPRYSSAQPMGILGQISSALADKVNGIKRTQATSTEQQAENKKITASYNRGNSTTASPTYDSISRPPTSSSLATVSPNLAVSKAQSSLASSTYQAHGYLPLFDGAGKAHTSSVYREQGIQPLPPQVRLPPEAFYGDRQLAAEASSRQVHYPIAPTDSTTYYSSANLDTTVVETHLRAKL